MEKKMNFSNSPTVYISGPSGLIGSHLTPHVKGYIPVSYRETPYDNFETHEDAVLVHLANFSKVLTPKSDFEKSIRYDIYNSIQLFDNFLSKNPDGRIIYLSTAGNMYSGFVNENSNPSPRSIYSCNKLYNENYLNLIGANSLIFQVGNIWGGSSHKERSNGLYDKMILHLKNNKPLTITCSIDTVISFIHIDDLISLLLKAIYHDQIKKGKWQVGTCSSSVVELMNIFKGLSFVLKSKNKPHKIHINSSLAERDFDWTPKHKTISLKP